MTPTVDDLTAALDALAHARAVLDWHCRVVDDMLAALTADTVEPDAADVVRREPAFRHTVRDVLRLRPNR